MGFLPAWGPLICLNKKVKAVGRGGQPQLLAANSPARTVSVAKSEKISTGHPQHL